MFVQRLESNCIYLFVLHHPNNPILLFYIIYKTWENTAHLLWKHDARSGRFAEPKQSFSLNFSQLLFCLGEPPLNLTVANKTHAWRHCLCSQAIVKVQKHPIPAPFKEINLQAPNG